MEQIGKAIGAVRQVKFAYNTVDAVIDVTTNMDLAMRREEDGTVDYSLKSVGKAVKSIETTVNRRMDDKVAKYHAIIDKVMAKGEALMAAESASNYSKNPYAINVSAYA